MIVSPIGKLLQRLAGRSQTVATNVVALQLAIKRCAADAEHASGKSFVAFYLLEHALDRRALDVFEIGRSHGVIAAQELSVTGGSCRPDAGGKVPGIDEAMIAEGDSALDAIFQFTHVARPVVLQKRFHGRAADLNRRAGSEAIEEPVYEHRDIAAAFAQARQVNRDNVQPEIKVFSE